MQVKRYEAASIQEALQSIKNDLGPEAVVLSTKTLRNTKPRLIEVIAAVDRGDPPPAGRARLERTEPPKRPGEEKEDRPEEGRHHKVQRGAIPDLDAYKDLREDLAQIKEGMETLLDFMGQGWSKTGDEPLVKVYRTLIDNGVGKTRAARLVAMILKDPRFAGAKGGEEIFAIAEDLLASVLPSPPKDTGRGRIKAFVGPTGVGKTTTVAKMAARYHLNEKRKTGLITTDTFRIAAVEQLKVYARIMGVPLAVAEDPEGFRRALDGFADREIILVDTPGKPLRDGDHLRRLREMFRDRGAVDVHLLLCPTAARDHLRETTRSYEALGYDELLFTKLDECRTFGAVFEVLAATGRPARYVTTGQDVPRDIEAVGPANLARLILRNTLH
ncbi:MAG TPA: flagellar biosynthesis protein FlhF [Syntrophales bacterium]|mgnify:FL=1|nr:flagellar biosynthesis protein FlhF [Syntrophales bacterium]